MSTAVQSALVGGGLALIGSLATLWLSNRAERQRAKLQFNAGIKAKLMDYEREDRLAIVRPLRDYLDGLGRTFGEISVEEFKQSRKDASGIWLINVRSQVLRGSTLLHSISDDELRAGLLELVGRVSALAGAVRDSLKTVPNTEEARDASAQVRQFNSELVPLLRDVYTKIDRYARQVDIPGLDD
jgi:hypothetical protein